MINAEVITGEAVPKSFLPFSPAVRAGDFIFLSGQASVDMEGNIIPGTFEEECRRTFENIAKVLAASEAGFQHVIQVRSFVGKQEYLPQFNTIYKEFFDAPYPARTTITGCLGELLKFEADVVVYMKK